jgi:ABC-type nitrate/sulfonate/bicarbonate transport system permease component
VTTHALTAPRTGFGLRRLRGPAVTVLSLAAGAAIWELIGRHTQRTSFVGFWPTMRALWAMIEDGELETALGESLELFALGLGISLVIGFFGGLLLARVQWLRIGMEPYVNALYATPSVALIPFILVFGFSLKQKLIVVVLFGIWPILINTLEGARSVSETLLEVAKSYRSNEPKLWRHVVIPYTLPYTMTGVRQAIARCLVGMIASEFLLSASGLGELIIRNTERFETGRVLAAVLTITILATILMAVGRAIENYFARWKAGV